MSKPVAVCISDIHYNLNTVHLADAAMRQAITLANKLNVPLIVAGDLHDTKANMRAECVNRMIKTFTLCETPCYILVGNHDKVNEKSEDNALGFLFALDNIYLVQTPVYCNEINAYLMPYQHDLEFLTTYLNELSINGCTKTIIMHQGITTADPGEYTHDKTAISTELVKDFRIVSGHYHSRQDIKCGRPRQGSIGLVSYIGNPYTLGFGESFHPEKGFRILNDDGTLDFVPTNLRKHVIVKVDLNDALNIQYSDKINDGDLVLLKLTGTKEQFISITKAKLLAVYKLPENTRIEFIPLESKLETKDISVTSKANTMDAFIDNLKTSDSQKTRLKHLWRHLCE